MNKKMYISPVVRAFELHSPVLLAGSLRATTPAGELEYEGVEETEHSVW